MSRPPWRTVSSGPLPIFSLDCWSSCFGVMWVVYIFWRSKPCLRYQWQINVPYFPMHLVPRSFGSRFLQPRSSFLFGWTPISLFFPLHPLRGDISVTKLLCGKSEIFLPIFSSRTFVVSQLLCKSFCHLEFIFVFGVRWWPSHMFCMSLYTSLNTICRLGYFHSILCLFSLCRILPDHRDMGLFLGSLFSSTDLHACSYTSTRLVWLQ